MILHFDGATSPQRDDVTFRAAASNLVTKDSLFVSTEAPRALHMKLTKAGAADHDAGASDRARS